MVRPRAFLDYSNGYGGIIDANSEEIGTVAMQDALG